MKAYSWLMVLLACSAVAEPLVVPGNDSVVWPAEAADAELAGEEPGGGTAADVVASLRWDPGAFDVIVRETPGEDYDARVTFASPRPSGDKRIDTVVLRWYRPPPPPEVSPPAPEVPLPASDVAFENPGAGVGVLLVHTLHPDMPIATFLARGLRARGVNGFVLELPGYGSRVGGQRRMTGVTALMHGPQATTDIRRAFDAIRAIGDAGLMDLDPDRLMIQGTSLGSFFATVASAIDGCFAQTFLVLSGGDVVDILEHGQKDAYHVRGALAHHGYTAEKLRALLDPVEPLRVASRLNPEVTWMFNARDDVVVPARNANLLAEAIGLDPSHHVWMSGNHYTSFLLLPGVLDRMLSEMGVGGEVGR